MPLPREYDRDEVDRAFAELIAGYHRTAERPDPVPESTTPEPATPPAPLEPAPVDEPLFRFTTPEPAPTPPPVEPRYRPEPLPPLRRPGPAALLGWSGVVFACLVTLIAAVGVRMPAWVGWLAVGAFILGFCVLLTQLPRHRPPDAGDGAVL